MWCLTEHQYSINLILIGVMMIVNEESSTHRWRFFPSASLRTCTATSTTLNVWCFVVSLWPGRFFNTKAQRHQDTQRKNIKILVFLSDLLILALKAKPNQRSNNARDVYWRLPKLVKVEPSMTKTFQQNIGAPFCHLLSSKVFGLPCHTTVLPDFRLRQ